MSNLSLQLPSRKRFAIRIERNQARQSNAFQKLNVTLRYNCAKALLKIKNSYTFYTEQKG